MQITNTIKFIILNSQLYIINYKINIKLVLPNNIIIFPASNILPMKIVNVGLAQKLLWKKTVKITDFLLKNIKIYILDKNYIRGLIKPF